MNTAMTALLTRKGELEQGGHTDTESDSRVGKH